jgi:GntR family transcriptional regulator
MANASRRQPLYGQLVDLLCQKIENEMEPGDILPSERDLSQMYGMSRTTVRLAMQELEEMGMVTRRHGKGTFVSNSGREATDLMGTYSFTQQMHTMGRVPTNKVLELEVVEANKSIATHLSLPVGTKVVVARRLRLADDIPMMVECSCLPADPFGNITTEALETRSLYDIFEQDYGQHVGAAQESFSARLTHGDEAAMLEVADGSPVFHLVRTTKNDQGRVIEYTYSVARADQFEYKIVHVRSRASEPALPNA